MIVRRFQSLNIPIWPRLRPQLLNTRTGTCFHCCACRCCCATHGNPNASASGRGGGGGTLFFLKKQDYKLSRKYFSKSLNINNKYYPNILGIALSYFNNDNYEDAIKYFQKFIKFDPRNIQSINLLGNSYYIKKDFKEAINNYKKSLNINNNQPFINMHFIC